MKDITDGTIAVLKNYGIEVSDELKEDLLVEMRLAFKRIEGYIVNKVIQDAEPDNPLSITL